jgi:hypothetical protein
LLGDDAEIEFEFEFGANIDDLGTHSHRKGSVSFLLSIIDGPNPCAVYIRANWSLGNTQDRYIMGGAGEDELIGRLLSFLNLYDKSFASLPPHFDKEGMKKLREIGYDNLVTGFSNYSPGYRRCIPYFIALVLYQLPTLKEWWPAGSPVWGARIFVKLSNEDIIFLRDHILLGSWRCEETGMCATGVPTCVKQLEEIRMLRQDIVDMKKELKDDLSAQISSVPTELSTMLSAKFNIEGIRDLCVGDVQKMMDAQMAKMIEMFGALKEELVLAKKQRTAIMHLPESQFHAWPGDDIRHYVPHKYVFPVCDVMKLMRFWHTGDAMHGIGPLSVLQDRYRCDVGPKCKFNMSKAAKVIAEIKSAAMIPDELTGDSILDYGDSITKSNYENVCEIGLKSLVHRLYAGKVPQTYYELTYTTIAKKISLYKSASKVSCDVV